jgi:DDE superfamily endonuclease
MDENDYGYESSVSSDSEVSTKRIKRNTREAVIVIVAAVLIATTTPLEPPRIGNCRGESLQALQYVRSWDDGMFRRQFRLCRLDFGYLLTLITPLIQRDEAKARNSSGSSISPEMRFMITLRILAGAKYFDMIWYRFDVDHVNEYVLDCLHAINSVLNNINIPATEAEWRAESEQFREVLVKKHGASFGDECMRGITGAGDGLVIQICEPVLSDLDGKPSKIYVNRKGFFALLVQAFCGACKKFWSFNVGWPGATNDITAYKQTDLYHMSTANQIPDFVSYVLDEAYSSCGGRHLTPFSSSQLRKAQYPSAHPALYSKMRTFNHTLSSQRITIERAFGQLIRRWGMLWCSNSSRLKNVSVIVLVCAKLHNLCVDKWMINGRRGSLTGSSELVEEIPMHDGIENNRPTDEEVATRLQNRYNEIGIRSAANYCRVSMMEDVWETGLRITDETDLAGLPTPN